jgi:hypothetical protein
MRLVVIESPYAPREGDPLRPLEAQLERNLAYARAAMRDCFAHGEAPFASHALYTQPGVLIDTNPDERKLGMRAGFTWRRCAHATVVYHDLGMSQGMKTGIAHAQSIGQAVEFRSLREWAGGKRPQPGVKP